jgi:4,5-dihydroxyphthalate decarboxylase
MNRGSRNLSLSLACWDYDRTRALQDGRVAMDGIDLTYLSLPVEETFFRQMRHREFDISELSLSSYVVSLNADKPPFIALPIFPSRFFRHNGIYVNANSGIREPKDLIGKRVGTPEFQLTACVWIRGILADEYKVPVWSTSHWQGGLENAGRVEKANVQLPAEARYEVIPETKTLSDMLEAGEIDALYSPRAPSSFLKGSPAVKRLFENYYDVEREYYTRTKIFPIMHIIAVKRELYEQHPWIIQSIYKAFVQAQRIAYDDLHQLAALKAMLPWLPKHLQDTEQILGKDYWAYGFEPNVNVLTTFLRYSREQGMSRKNLTPRDLFAPESLEQFKI